jgi:ClpP class serine protease
MVDQNKSQTGAKASPMADADAARARLGEEQQAAGRAFEKGREAIREQASSLAQGAQEEAYARSEALRGQAADGLHTFADAVRKARSELDEKNMGPVSGLVGQAADGLESLSRSLQNTSASEMLDGVRDFGRRNPVSFIAASVLAGIALGRFAGASARRPHDDAGRGRAPAPGAAPSSASRPVPAYPAAPTPTTPRTSGDFT